MDYQEEQAQELEILTSIYTEDEFEQISLTEYIIKVTPDTDKPDPPQFALHVKLPPTYPEVVPELSLSLTATSPRSPVPKDQYPEILSKLNSSAEENLGMAMIFTLVSILKETLEELLISADEKAKEAQRIAEECERQKAREEVEEQIIKSIRRTPVTHELFLEWKGNFDKWKAEQKKKGNDVENIRGRNREKERREEGRLTGREWFEKMRLEAGEGFEAGEEDGLMEKEGSDREDLDEVEVTSKKMGEMKVS